MSNKVSALAILGLSVVCIGMLWSNLQNNTVPGVQPLEQELGENVGGISIEADAFQRAFADQYIVHFEISQRSKTRNQAYKLLEEHRGKILALFDKMNISRNEFEQTGVKNHEDNYHERGKVTFLGYSSSQHFTVRLNSRAKADSLETELASLPFVSNALVQGALKDPDSLERATIRIACEKALRMASEYSNSVGAKVGRVYSIEGNSKLKQYDDDNSSYPDSVGASARLKGDFRLADDNDDGKSFISVTQYETQKFPADDFSATVSVFKTGAKKEEIFQLLNSEMDSVIALARNLGVKESDVGVQSMNIHKRFDYDMRHETDKSKIYYGEQTVKVPFTDKSDAAAFVAALSAMENVKVDRAQAELKNRDSLNVLVVNTAGKKALDRAAAFAEGFGGKMGRVVAVGNGDFRGVVRSYTSAEEYGSVMEILSAGNGDELSIADSVVISSFIKVVTELEY